MSRTTYFTALLVVVAAAIFAPLSQAMTVITDNSPSQNGSGQGAYYVDTTDAFSRAVAIADSGANQPVAPQRFTTENAPSQNRVSLLNAAETGALAPGSGSFDWGDAGVGAGTVGGIVLLIGAAMLATVRRSGNRRLVL